VIYLRNDLDVVYNTNENVPSSTIHQPLQVTLRIQNSLDNGTSSNFSFVWWLEMQTCFADFANKKSLRFKIEIHILTLIDCWYVQNCSIRSVS